MSPDGRTILFDEEGEGGGPAYSAFVRRTDGSPAVRIADGYALRLSPDGASALTALPSDPPGAYTLVPLGPGEPRKIRVPLQQVLGTPRFSPDGKRLYVVGNQTTEQPRTCEFTIDSGAVRALTPTGTTGTAVSPDGRQILVGTADGKRLSWPLDGGQPRELVGISAQDAFVAWTNESGVAFVSATSPKGRDVARVDLATGRRQPFLTLGLNDSAGVRGLGVPLMSADGRTYAYRYSQMLSDLFVGTGVN